MTIINVSPNRLVQLGYEGEDRVTILRFGYSEKWLENGEGIFTVRVLRNGENKAYNAQIVDDDRENSTIDMTVTDVELSKKGYGEMQLVYTGADFVKKSPVYKYYVSRSVDEAVDPPESDVYTQLIESLSELQADIRQIDGDVADLSELTAAKIGDLTELTTESKTDLVSAINEVNEHGGGGGSVTVDSELSTTSRNPVQNKVITARINGLDSDVGTLRTSVQGKADTQTVSALADAVQDLDGDVQGLQTAVQSKADTATVTALSGTVSGLQTTVQNKADTSTVTALSGTVSALSDAAQQYMEQTSAALSDLEDYKANTSDVSYELATKADKSYVDTQLSGKASTATATESSDGLMSAQDKSRLDAVYEDYSSALEAIGGGS